MPRRMLEHAVSVDDVGRLDALVARLASLSRDKAQRLIRHGGVTIDGQPVTSDFHRVAAGDVLVITFDPHNIPRDTAATRPWRDPAFRIVFEDDTLIVVDKAAGVLTVPTGEAAPDANTLVGRVTAYLRKTNRGKAAHVVHRLDQGTTGLLVFAKSAAVAAQLRGQFAARKPQRVYHALVAGRVAADRGTFRSHLVTTPNLDRRSVKPAGESASLRGSARAQRGQEAITHYRVIRRYADYTHVECRLETGRRNQIRVHFAEADHPVLGDRRYRPDLAAHPRWPRRSRGLALHAATLAFDHPATGELLRFEAPPPAAMHAMTDATAATRVRQG